ncbi:MAG: hypothetical protein V7678_00685 [Brevundimonas sp.]
MARSLHSRRRHPPSGTAAMTALAARAFDVLAVALVFLAFG